MLQELLGFSKENQPNQVSTNLENQTSTVTSCHVQNTNNFEQYLVPPTCNAETRSNLDYSRPTQILIKTQ